MNLILFLGRANAAREAGLEPLANIIDTDMYPEEPPIIVAKQYVQERDIIFPAGTCENVWFRWSKK